MARKPGIFRQTDVTKALKAAQAAGLEPRSVRIDAAGCIVVDLLTEAAPAQPETPFDEWKRRSDGRAAQGN